MPLLNIGGRGGTTFPITIHIDQKWTIRKEINPGHNAFYFGSSTWWSEDDGGNHTITPGNVRIRRGLLKTSGGVQKTLTRITFTAPDGTEYELRDQLTGGQPQVIGGAPFNRQRVFVSADGTAATFISDADVLDGYYYDDDGVYYPAYGYLMLRDGTRFRIDENKVSWMRDRNGNKVTFTYDFFKRVTAIADSLNRQVTITYDNSSGGTTTYDQINFKGFGGAARTIKIGHCLRSQAMRSDTFAPSPLFPGLTGVDNSNPPVINYIELPDGRQYQLQYNGYAELARIVLPTGGAIEYDWANGLTDGASSGLFTLNLDKYVYRRVVERRLYPDGASGSAYESRMTYSRPETTAGNPANTILVDQYNSSGTLLARSQHYFYGSARDSFGKKATDYSAWQDSKEYKTEIFNTDGVTLLRRVENTFEQRAAVAWWTSGSSTAPPNDVRPTETVTTLADTNQMSKQSFGYDDSVPFNNQNNVKEYDFGSGSAGALLRETRTTYLTDPSYTDTTIHLRNLPLQVSVYDGGAIERARSTTEYDNYTLDGSDCLHSYHCPLLPRPNISGFDSSFGTSYTMRGNATASTHYLLVNGSITGSISVYSQYDIAGNGIKSIDPRSTLTNIIATTLEYDDRFGGPNGEARANSVPPELSGLTTYALPTKVINALGQATYAQFDYYLGKPVDGEDANGIVASGYYDDLLDRPKQVKRAVGTTAENHSTFSYDDIGRSITTTSDLDSMDDGALVGKLFYDQMGRTIETQQYEGGINYISVQTQYDVQGRAYKTSNPFRLWQSETAVWTTSAFDALGRVTTVTTPDSAVVNTYYNGDRVLMKDQRDNERISRTNALGQLKDVWEITAADSATEAVSFPGHSEVTNGYHTSYAYDTLDNLVTVTQGAEPRTFIYDSLKRLTSATNPESGAVSYVYDAAGNLTQKTDARLITTTIAYDALNRPTSRSYNDSPQTPTVNYFYDSQTLPSGAPTFDRGYATGRLVAVTYGGGSAGNYSGFDALGRTVRKIQRTDSVNYLSEAFYNVSAMIGEAYPNVPGYSDRREVDYTFDTAGRVTSSKSGATGYANGAQVSGISYASHGGLASETYDNSRVHAITYNNRLQPSEIKLGTTSNPTSILDLTYNYGTTNNNGNVQSIGYSAGLFSYTQTFSYDSLNRLSTATETSGGNTSWTQTNGYDRYGNRWIDLGGGNQSLYFTPSTNQISGWSYDAAGNLLNDGAHAYTYDAENKIRTVDGNTAYVYDGEGQRVRKLVGENTRFVYGISGRLIMEFNGSSGSLTKEYVYGGGSMVTIAPNGKGSLGVQYLTSDHLGTPRVATKANGTVAARHDYKPFGEEIFAGTGGRTTPQGYSATDGVRQKFTSKERDNETGLDYFVNRYYSSLQGRFNTTDPTLLSANAFNPQSWNRYAYVLNNPLMYVDPLGLWELYTQDIYKTKKNSDGTSTQVLDHRAVYARKTSEKDDGASLAKQLGLKGKDATSFAEKIGGGNDVRLANQGGDVGRVLRRVESGLTDQAKWETKHAGKLDELAKKEVYGPAPVDCSRTSYEIGLGGSGLLEVGTNFLDPLLDLEASPVSADDAHVGDIIRYGVGKDNVAAHFDNFIFRNDDGTPVAFSKTGTTGRFQIVGAAQLEGGSYGKIRGRNDGDSGYYRRK